MKYHNITHDDMLNGVGLRVVLWVSGCTHNCFKCHNPITWDKNYGLEYDDAAKDEIFSELEKDYIDGLTISGGDPLHPDNRDCIEKLCKEAKKEFPLKTIWLYTGFVWENINRLDLINYIDVIVDGRFINELRDPKLHWKGSSNQRVIDVKKSLKKGEVVLLA